MVKNNFDCVSNQSWADKLCRLELANDCDPESIQGGKNCIAVSHGIDHDRAIQIASIDEVPHLIQTSNFDFDREVNTAALMLNNQRLFLEYPASSILSPYDAGPTKEKELIRYNRSFNSSKEKRLIITEIQLALQLITSSKTIVEDAMLISDELITNSIFNAPYTDDENLNIGASRFTHEVTLSPGKHGRVFMALNNSNLLIGCLDPFGKLNISSLLRRIVDCYKNGLGASIRYNDGGAGIGSFMVYERSTSYYVAVEKNKRTIICATLPLGLSIRKRREMPKNIHLLEL